MNSYVGQRQLCFEVLSAPVAKARARVTVRGGKPHAFTPRKTEEAEWRIRTAFCAAFPSHRPVEGPVSLTVIAWLAMPASVPKKRRLSALPTTRPDVDNYLKTALDALNGVAWRDDSQVVSVTCEKRYALEFSPCWSITLGFVAPAIVAPSIPAQETAISNGDQTTVLRRSLG